MTATLFGTDAHPTQLLDAVASDWLPSREDDRSAIEAAIEASLRDHGEVHIALVRARLTREVAPHMLGAVLSAWAVRHGEPVGWRPNGDTKSGNGAKPSRVWIRRTA